MEIRKQVETGSYARGIQRQGRRDKNAKRKGNRYTKVASQQRELLKKRRRNI
jgi:hypothetical protein